MLVTMGSTYSVHVKVPIIDLDENTRLTCMACWPTVYDGAGAPSEMADYLCIVYARGEHYSQWEVIEALKAYGATSARWLDDFFRVV